MNTLTVTGMSCNHCRESVLKAVSAVKGVEEVAVDLASGKLDWKGDATADSIAKAIVAIGFDVSKG